MFSNQPSTRRLTLADISQTGAGLPNRCIAYGPEGVGKTSFGVCAPRPVFLLTRGETGLITLIDSGQVPKTPHFPELQSWAEILAAIRILTDEPHDYRTLVVDTMNGAERLCHEFVCQRDFGGNWGRDGFTAYMTGYDIAQGEWRKLLDALDQLRERRRISIMALAHSRVVTFKNPEGSDYDRFTPDLHHKTWASFAAALQVNKQSPYSQDSSPADGQQATTTPTEV